MIDRRFSLTVGFFALACGNVEQATTRAEATELPAASSPPPSEPVPTPSAPSAEGDDTACVRAEPCCRAFVAAIGDEAEANRARTACESLSMVEALGGAANDACANAIAGWRQALIAHERNVPAACATSVE